MNVECPSCAAKFRIPPEAVSPEGRRLRCSSCGHVWLFLPVSDDQGVDQGGRPAAVLSEQKTQDDQVASSPAADNSFVAPVQMSSDSVPEEHVDSQEHGGGSPVSLESTPVPDLDFATALRQARARPPIETPSKISTFFYTEGIAWRGYLAAFGVLVIVAGAVFVSQESLIRLFPKTQALYQLFGEVFDAESPLVLDQVQVAIKDRHGLAAQIEVTGMLINLSDREQDIPPLRVTLLGEGGGHVVATWVFQPEFKTLKGESSAPVSTQKSVPDITDVVTVDLGFVTNPSQD